MQSRLPKRRQLGGEILTFACESEVSRMWGFTASVRAFYIGFLHWG
jgi:hypothetical protein